MKLRLLFSLFLLIACIQGYAQKTISLNGNWDFALAKTASEADRLAGFHSPTFKSNQFKPIAVPSNWSVLGYEEPVYRGFEGDVASEGFYLHEFTVPKDWSGKRVVLHFGGVWSSAEVWLNGEYIGRHDAGFTSFAFVVSGKLRTDGKNRLAVRVRQVTHEYKFDVNDDWTLGGIYRDVTLEAMPAKRWLDGVVAQTIFDNQFEDADLKVRTMVSDRHKNTLPGNYPSPGEPYDLRFTLTTKDGKEVLQRKVTIPAHVATDREVALTFRVESPKHWTAETPYLYNLKVDLLEKGQVAHTREERIGFRQVSTEGGIFRINGQAVKLRGVNRHDEHPDVGRATTREHWLQDIRLMKAANINYVRMSHYTPAKGFIELCDELGLYVGNEVTLGGAGNGRMTDPSYSGPVLIRSYETVVRDINSPSIIYWSIGNEDPLTLLHMASLKLVKALDPTRPVLIPWRSESWLPEEIDILSSHYWQPWEYDQLGGQATRPIITTEYTHSYGVDGFGGLDARWKALTKHPSGAGAAIWMWADQGIKTPVRNPKKKNIYNDNDEYLRIDGAGWDGIVDSYRNITRDYLETKAVYAPVFPAVDKVTFTSGEDSVRIPIQNEFDFIDLNTIKIAWTVYEDEKEIISGNSSIEGQPHTTSAIKLPIGKLNALHAGKTYYAQLIFAHADGSEINRRSVELEPLMKPDFPATTHANFRVATTNANVAVEADDAKYVFDSKTGQLSTATWKGEPLVTGLKPIIWRKPDQSEVSVIGRHNVSKGKHLDAYTPAVLAWNVEEHENQVTIHARVKYTVDRANSFTTTYRYTIGRDGKLYVWYEIMPEVEVPSVPVVGMSLQSPTTLNQIHWLGLGPHDAYFNKQAASILGVWGGEAGSQYVTGNKATRWIERSGKAGARLRIYSNGYMEHRATDLGTIHILSRVMGRPEKGRKPDDSIPSLQTDAGKPFIGEFSLMPMEGI